MSANGRVCGFQAWRCALIPALAWLLPHTAVAAVFRVGSAGDYATVQAGVDAALGVLGTHEVRVQAGTFSEHVSITQNAGTLTLSGGWDAAFSARNDTTGSTINATASGRGLSVNLRGSASLTVRGMLIVGGVDTQSGGGAWVALQDTAFLRLTSMRFIFNSVQASATSVGFGGALSLSATGQSAAIIEDVDFLSNSSSNSSGQAIGAGLFVSVDNSSNVLVQRCIFDANTATASSNYVANGVGVYGILRDTGHLSVNDSRFHANRIVGDGGTQGALFDISCTGACQLDLTRDVFDGNRGALGQFQLSVDNFGSSNNQAIVRVDNTLIARGEGSGAVFRSTTARNNVVNVTVTAHPGAGVQFDGNWGLSNSIVRGNFRDVVNTSIGISQNNLTGAVDPLFADPANGNYRLTASSPARNAGTASPTAGLSLFDLLGETRNNESTPDIGAYEFGDRVFRSRFERLQ